MGFLKFPRAMPEEILNKIKNYLKSNPKIIPIIVFQLLLLVCAGLLVFGHPKLAEAVSVIAYFIILTGTIILLISSIRGASSD